MNVRCAPAESRYPDDTGNGKLFAYLDLHVQKDIKTLRGLVREADVFRTATSAQGCRAAASTRSCRRQRHSLTSSV
jgi:hypothetical protein